MADFCQECSIEIFGEDMGDMSGLSTPEDTNAGLYASTLCEGCGWILVDHAGLRQTEKLPETREDSDGRLMVRYTPRTDLA